YQKEDGFLPFLEGMIERGLELSFYLPNAIHLKLLDGEIAVLMRRAGFKEIRLGYESSAESFHTAHDGKVKPGDFEESVRLLLDAGFAGSQLMAYILAGLPGQRWEEVEESIHRVTSVGIQASVAEYSPVPGTGMWKVAVDASSFPIADEPLYQNNSIMPLRWSGFTPRDLQRMKDLSRELSPARVPVDDL
ncbi:MAG: radical SAM protein, partial [Spirochaetales bacterium]|nr:radical SAM protein [Spirochaetales bacterium]